MRAVLAGTDTIAVGTMRYMVIERYKRGPGLVYARAAERGRMLPPGLLYVESWIDGRTLDCCYQLMETNDPKLFDEWTAQWSDLVEFEIVPVISSAEAAGRAARDGGADPRGAR